MTQAARLPTTWLAAQRRTLARRGDVQAHVTLRVSQNRSAPRQRGLIDHADGHAMRGAFISGETPRILQTDAVVMNHHMRLPMYLMNRDDPCSILAVYPISACAMFDPRPASVDVVLSVDRRAQRGLPRSAWIAALSVDCRAQRVRVRPVHRASLCCPSGRAIFRARTRARPFAPRCVLCGVCVRSCVCAGVRACVCVRVCVRV